MRLSWGALLLAAIGTAQTFDVVIANGRVMDPASGLDAVRHVGIRGKAVAAISESPLSGRMTIDARGLVVAPGFIDLHAHGQDDENHRYQARDGVTTALELEVGVSPVAEWYKRKAGRALIHYGATVGHIPARMAVLGDSGKLLPRDAAVSRKAMAADQRAMEELVRRGLDEGALGLGLGITYVPAATRQEVLSLFRIAGERRMPVFVHVRHMGSLEPNVIDAMQEVIANAAITGTPLHIVHITSVSLRLTGEVLAMIDGARSRGLDVTTEAYPYTAAMTGLESAIFLPGWQERLQMGYQDLQWAATGERLTAETFERYRKQGGMTILHMIPEEVVRTALAHPRVMIAIDGTITGGKGHPRGAGTFARVLGRYVREEKVLTLMDALRRMSWMPAQRLEAVTQQMRRKGRIQIGCDADITIFDPARVTDRATFDNPAQYSGGIPHVLVAGVPVVRDGKLVEGVFPGEPVRR
jgi:dihydroorotase